MSDPRERLGALLNLAGHPTTPLPEAETALRMARSLADKHSSLAREFGFRLASCSALLGVRALREALDQFGEIK